jgi:hypothetical protein
VAAVALGGVVLLWGNDVSLSRMWWSLALVLVLLCVFQVLIGASRRAEPGGHAPPSEAIPQEVV